MTTAVDERQIRIVVWGIQGVDFAGRFEAFVGAARLKTWPGLAEVPIAKQARAGWSDVQDNYMFHRVLITPRAPMAEGWYVVMAERSAADFVPAGGTIVLRDGIGAARLRLGSEPMLRGLEEWAPPTNRVSLYFSEEVKADRDLGEIVMFESPARGPARCTESYPLSRGGLSVRDIVKSCGSGVIKRPPSGTIFSIVPC